MDSEDNNTYLIIEVREEPGLLDRFVRHVVRHAVILAVSFACGWAGIYVVAFFLAVIF